MDSMRVVVGKREAGDADENAYIRAAALNPYWTCRRTSPRAHRANVVKQGLVLSDRQRLSAAVRLEPQSDGDRPEHGRLASPSPTGASKCACASCRAPTMRWAR